MNPYEFQELAKFGTAYLQREKIARETAKQTKLLEEQISAARKIRDEEARSAERNRVIRAKEEQDKIENERIAARQRAHAVHQKAQQAEARRKREVAKPLAASPQIKQRTGAKFCYECGASAQKDDKFCASCGTHLRRETASKTDNSSEGKSSKNPEPLENPIVILAIREALNKPTGSLSVSDVEKIKTLSFWKTEIDDEGLRSIASLLQLTSLNLKHTRITNEGLKELAKLQQLTKLSLPTQITDIGLRNLAHLQLLDLDLMHTQITNSGLKDLAKLQLLCILDLKRTRTTNEGVAELKRALPKCKIRH